MQYSNLIPCLKLINFYKSTAIKITLEHQKNLIHKDVKKYANDKNSDNNKNQICANICKQAMTYSLCHFALPIAHSNYFRHCKDALHII